MTRRTLFRFGKEYLARLQRDRATSVASELAYAFLFSVFPFLIFAVTALAYTPVSADFVIGFVARYVPEPLIGTIEEIARGVLERRSGGLLSVGAFAALWSATRAANAAVFAVNQAYDASPERSFWRSRLLALGITILLLSAILVSFVFPVFGWLLARFSHLFGLSAEVLAVWGVLRWLLSFLLLVTGFLVIYYLAPAIELRVSETVPGAVFAAVGWQVVSYGFSFYLTNFANYSAVYGSLGSVIALMVWFYLAALLLILGAELNAQLHAIGSGRTPPRSSSGGGAKKGRRPNRSRASRRRAWFGFAVLLVAPRSVAAADPLELLASVFRKPPVEILVEGVSGAVLENVRAAVALPPGLVRGREVNVPWLERFARQAEDAARDALKPFGYYEAQVRTSIEPREEGRYRLRVSVEQGPPVLVRRVEVSLLGPGREQDRLQELVRRFPLREGDVLHQVRYDQAKADLESEAVTLGYLDAAFSRHEIRVSRAERWAEVFLTLDTGLRYRFAETRLEGAPEYPEPFLRRFISYRRGEAFAVTELARTQANLINSERFGQAVVRPDRERKQADQMPVLIELKPLPPKRFRPGIGYGTDTGARVSLQYRDLNVFETGQEFETSANVAERAQRGEVAYRFPSSRNVESFRAVRANYQREETETYTTRILSAEAEETRGFARGISATAFVRLQQESFDVGGESRLARLVLPGLRGVMRRQDSVVRPTEGHQVRAEVRGTHELLGSNTSLIQLVLDAGLLLPLPYRLSLLTRFEGGVTAQDDPFAELPASLRFFAGGDQSVRGYAYRSLGPRDDEGDVVGGRNLLVGSLELERALFRKWGTAVFYDAGNAFDDPKGLVLRQGAGLGLRYYSPVGPIRLDLARQIGERNPRFRVHLSVGLQL